MPRFRSCAGLLAAALFLANPSVARAEDVAPPASALVEDPDEAAYDVPGRIVVDLRDELGASDVLRLAAELGVVLSASALEPETRVEIAAVPIGEESAFIAKLRGDPRVESVEPLARVRASFVPNDPLFADQWHLDRIGARRAWDFATGRGVTVAVVDTGIACEDHGPYAKGSDLARTECVEGRNFVQGTTHASDDQGHGTHVAGTIAQSTDNGLGAAGLAFHARLMPVKVLNAEGWGSTVDVADGIRWAADHGAQVINLSLGGPRNAGVLGRAIAHARARGAVVVAAAGNTSGRVQYPGATAGVIAVSATDARDEIARFSSRGDAIDLAAPGVEVVQQTICNRGLDRCERFPGFSGTSMAAPHVAGAAAMLVSLGVSQPDEVEARLKFSSRSRGTRLEERRRYGAGLLDAAAAVERVTFGHAAVRLIALAMGAWIAGRGRLRRSSLARPTFWLLALMTGPGLFFAAPWAMRRTSLAVELLARPFADWDLALDVNLHRWLPLAHVGVPLAFVALAFGARRFRPAIAGVATGTAAYLVSVAVLGEAFLPFGRVALVLWCALHAAACLWIARVSLIEPA